MRSVCGWSIWCMVPLLVQSKTTEEYLSTNQCSVIREVIYSAHVKQFGNLILKELKGSHGYQVRGSWRFETVQYQSLLNWPRASKTYIDDSMESTDSSSKIIRQFVAEFGALKTREEAK